MEKVILAGDLSLSCPAFSVVKIRDGKAEVVHLSHIKTNSKHWIGERLFQIYKHVDSILEQFPITHVVIEKGFNRFATATAQLQRVVGVFYFTLYRKGYSSCEELSPTTVKKEITGNGKASKEELATNLYRFVGHLKYATDDESDSVGVAIAYAIKKGWLK